MSYTPGKLVNFPDDSEREHQKIAAEFEAHLAHIEFMSARLRVLEERPVALVPVPVPTSVPTPVPVPVPSSSADVLWRWDAKTIAPFSIQAAHPSRVSLGMAGGRNAVRLLTLAGDSGIANSQTWERADLQLSQELSDGYEGREWWLRHMIWLPGDYTDPPQSPANAQPWYTSVLFDFHNTTQGGWQANWQVEGMPKTGASPDRQTGICGQIAYGGQQAPTKIRFPAVGAPRFASTRNVWHIFEYHARWSATDGIFDAWLNGQPFASHRGPTLYPGQGVYLKLANYHTPHGAASAVLHGPIVRAKTREALG